MLAATHAIAGGLIAKSAATPEIGYLLALLSHPLLDLFPHWDLHTRHNEKNKFTIVWTSLTDAGIGVAISFLLFSKSVSWQVLLLTIFFAQFFDWLESPLHVLDWKFPPFSTIKKIQHHWHTKLNFPWGLLPQLVILAFAIFFSR